MHVTDDELVAHYYGDLSEVAEARTSAHLQECEVCRASLSRLKRVMAAIDVARPSEPPKDFEAKAWRRLQPALASERSGGSGMGWSPGSVWKIGGWGAMAAGLLLAAFLAGRQYQGNGAIGARGANGADGATSAHGAVDAEARERVLLVDLRDHLDRTEQALVEFVSRSDADRDGEERSRSEDLVVANRLYRDSAEATGDHTVTDVLEDLERVLIEIASGPADARPAEIQAIRRRIDAKDLLFKLRVMRMELEQRASDPRPVKRQGPTT